MAKTTGLLAILFLLVVSEAKASLPTCQLQLTSKSQNINQSLDIVLPTVYLALATIDGITIDFQLQQTAQGYVMRLDEQGDGINWMDSQTAVAPNSPAGSIALHDALHTFNTTVTCQF